MFLARKQIRLLRVMASRTWAEFLSSDDEETKLQYLAANQERVGRAIEYDRATPEAVSRKWWKFEDGVISG